ncbi:MAG: DNA replication/repair protein RecF [Lachnospiraceae bacterium]|nr:DNA replication/repair protein RecF [Lachnospiraceae bacterium]
MIIKSLELKNYRNYSDLHISFDKRTNILYGDNAQGKTNILESLYVSATTKSHRGSHDREMIRFGEEESHIRTIVEKDGTDRQIDLHLKKNSTKGIAIDRIPIRRAGELFGMLNIVFFSPEDLNIIKDGPSRRRRFMDMEMGQIDRIYMDDLAHYNRVLKQRNQLLKDLYYKPDLEETLPVWDEQLAFYGKKVADQRKNFINDLNELTSVIHSRISGGKESLMLEYEPGCDADHLPDILEKSREKDKRTGMTSCGPHRDDICFYINGTDIRRYGSQGQQRTSALSLKLAEIAFVKRVIYDTPVLLLDDVLSELDSKRQNYLLNSIGDVQTMITCTGLDDFVKNRFRINRIFYIENGTCCDQVNPKE